MNFEVIEADQAHSESWEERATIRTRPRRRLEDDEKLIFPISRQPWVMGATFIRECAHLQHCVLVQSLYKFINNVVIFETEIVDKSLPATAKLNGPDPTAWLRETLEKLPTWPNSRIDELLPRSERLFARWLGWTLTNAFPVSAV